jgi:hypothetical protein
MTLEVIEILPSSLLLASCSSKVRVAAEKNISNEHLGKTGRKVIDLLGLSLEMIIHL